MSKLKKALEKAKETRGKGEQTFIQRDQRSDFEAKKKSSDSLMHRPEINIAYSDTKIRKIDDNVLKKGKVISLFHDYDNIDQIKTLRTQILNQLNESGGNSFLVTSAHP
jgi:hypothetical protein